MGKDSTEATVQQATTRVEGSEWDSNEFSETAFLFKLHLVAFKSCGEHIHEYGMQDFTECTCVSGLFSQAMAVFDAYATRCRHASGKSKETNENSEQLSGCVHEDDSCHRQKRRERDHWRARVFLVSMTDGGVLAHSIRRAAFEVFVQQTSIRWRTKKLERVHAGCTNRHHTQRERQSETVTELQDTSHAAEHPLRTGRVACATVLFAKDSACIATLLNRDTRHDRRVPETDRAAQDSPVETSQLHDETDQTDRQKLEDKFRTMTWLRCRASRQTVQGREFRGQDRLGVDTTDLFETDGARARDESVRSRELDDGERS